MSTKYVISYDDMDEMRDASREMLNYWGDCLNNIVMALDALSNLDMQGDLAESIRAYIKDIHGNIIQGLGQAYKLFFDDLALYQNEIHQIDDGDKSVLPEEDFEELYDGIVKERSSMIENTNDLMKCLNSVKDLCNFSMPDVDDFLDGYTIVAKKLVELDNDIDTVEYKYANSEGLKQLDKLSDSLEKLIEEKTNKDSGYIDSYQLDDIKNENVGKIFFGINYETNMYAISIHSAIEKAHTNEETRRILAAKKYDAGKKLLWAAGATVLTIATFGTGPLIVSSSISLGFALSDGYEAYDYINQLQKGDINAKGFNPARDIFFGGSECAYAIGELVIPAAGGKGYSLLKNKNIVKGNVLEMISFDSPVGDSKILSTANKGYTVVNSINSISSDDEFMYEDKFKDLSKGNPFEKNKGEDAE